MVGTPEANRSYRVRPDPEIAKQQFEMASTISDSVKGDEAASLFPANPRVTTGSRPMFESCSTIVCACCVVVPPPNVTSTVLPGFRGTLSRVIMYCGPRKRARSLHVEKGNSLVMLPSIATSDWHCARPRSWMLI